MPRDFSALLLLLPAAWLAAQQSTPPAPRTIGYLATTDGVSVSGSLTVTAGRAAIGNNGTVAAVTQPAEVTLARGGKLRICATTTVHLSSDSTATTPEAQASSPMMLALDRGALEARYTAPPGSDVVLTPDLRILLSGPGEVDLALRVSRSGDTCIDNRGEHAPYVTVSSLMEGGVYRVQPNQRVLFEHGSLASVIDREPEPCGCPTDAPAVVAAGETHPGGPSSTPADTAFPLAVSEGLAQPPATATTPMGPAGTPHAQVSAELSSTAPLGPPPPLPPPAAATATTLKAAPGSTALPGKGGFFHSIGHFFSRLFNS